MSRLLTGYAVSYNRRHRRHGHLFQNRYKSILCQEDAYLLELVRYMPVRRGHHGAQAAHPERLGADYLNSHYSSPEKR